MTECCQNLVSISAFNEECVLIATEYITVLKAGKLHAHVERIGIQLSHHHRGHYNSWEFLQSMSDVLEENLLRYLLESPFAGESNDLVVNEHLILYVKLFLKA